MDKAEAVPSEDGIHCGECPFLESYGDNNELTAKCKLTDRDLMYYDYWIATECSDDPKVQKLNQED